MGRKTQPTHHWVNTWWVNGDISPSNMSVVDRLHLDYMQDFRLQCISDRKLFDLQDKNLFNTYMIYDRKITNNISYIP